jgi:hypothetical protein
VADGPLVVDAISVFLRLNSRLANWVEQAGAIVYTICPLPKKRHAKTHISSLIAPAFLFQNRRIH